MRATHPAIVLKGPADADHFRVKVGRYGDRWYTDPLDGCDIADASDWKGPAYSIVKGASGKDWSFVSIGRVVDDMVAHPDKYSQADRDALYDQANSANKRGLNLAAGRGTIIHWWFEDGLNGVPFRDVTELDLMAHRIPKESLPIALTYQAAVGAFFDTYQPELVVSEVVCIHRDLNGVGYGATGDAGLRIQGNIYATDFKSRGLSSDHGAYPEEAMQVGGAFAGAQYMIVTGPDGNPARAKVPEFAAGLIVSVKPDGCRLYPIDIPQAQTQWDALHAWWVAKRDEKKPIGRSWAPKAVPATDLAPLLEESIGAANLRRDSLVGRIKALVDAGHAERLTHVWPPDVPGFATDHPHGIDERRLILSAVQQVEHETSAPFHEDDAPPPVTSLPTRAAAAPVEDPDGPLVSDAHRDALNARYNALTVEQRAAIDPILPLFTNKVTPLGVPKQRIWSIVRALVLWAEAGWDDAIISDLLNEVTGTTNSYIDTFGVLTIEQADELTAMAKQIIAGTHTCSHQTDRWTLVAAA